MRKARTIIFTLFALTLVPAVPVAAQSRSAAQSEDGQQANGDERLICRGSVDTGSLVKGRRQCFTRAQWERIAGSRSKRSADQRNGQSRPSGG